MATGRVRPGSVPKLFPGQGDEVTVNVSLTRVLPRRPARTAWKGQRGEPGGEEPGEEGSQEAWRGGKGVRRRKPWLTREKLGFHL